MCPRDAWCSGLLQEGCLRLFKWKHVIHLVCFKMPGRATKIFRGYLCILSCFSYHEVCHPKVSDLQEKAALDCSVWPWVCLLWNLKGYLWHLSLGDPVSLQSMSRAALWTTAFLFQNTTFVALSLSLITVFLETVVNSEVLCADALFCPVSIAMNMFFRWDIYKTIDIPLLWP